MKCGGRFAVVTLLAGLAVGCGGAEEPEQSPSGPRLDQNAVAHPKHPDLHVELRGPNGGGGSTLWDEQDDGYFLGSRGGSSAGVTYTPIYDGTTDAGDRYLFELKFGDTLETREIVYDGERTEIEVTGDVKIVLRPDE